MLSQTKWWRRGMTALLAVALLCGSTWAKKPPKDDDPPPEPDPSPVTYTITWLDAFTSESFVRSINSHGHVVGYAQLPDLYGGAEFAWVYTPETGMVDLNTLLPAGSGWYLQFANDINDQGQIVGSGLRNGTDKVRNWRYTPALLDENGDELEPAIIEEVFPPSDDDQGSTATCINNHGEVAGLTQDASGVLHTWFFSDDLGAVPLAGGGNKPVALNEWSEALVQGRDPWHAIRVSLVGDPEYFYDVGQCYDMNASGEFVGWAYFEVPINRNKTTTVTRAIRHDGVAPLDLGAGDGSVASGINDHGDVVGNYAFSINGFAYLEKFQQLVHLDDAVFGDSTDVALWLHPDAVVYPERINNAGQIAGTLVLRGPDSVDHYGFILTPVP